MIDALFGSKTRVKLLHLFLNNPGKAFYVREITRLIDEQINSVRRELANMMTVGIITSQSADNKVFYQVNQRYEHYVPFRAIFARTGMSVQHQPVEAAPSQDWMEGIRSLPNLRVALASGVLVPGSDGRLDLLLVGDVPQTKMKAVIRRLEESEGREINYALMPYNEFYYRLSVRDKFISEVLAAKHQVISDSDNVLERR